MAAARPDPRDLVIIDEFSRPLHFFMDKGEYWRCDESEIPLASGEPDTRKVSKFVYANMYLEACLRESL